MASGQSVLVVDDEGSIRQLLAFTLRGLGLPVLEAGGGDEAVAVYDRHRGDIGAVLLDVRMEPVDGVATFWALRDLAPSLPIVFMTGHPGAYTPQELMGLGAVSVLAKPFPNLAEVGRLLGRLLGREE